MAYLTLHQISKTVSFSSYNLTIHLNLHKKLENILIKFGQIFFFIKGLQMFGVLTTNARPAAEGIFFEFFLDT